jgi:hypothetical protein
MPTTKKYRDNYDHIRWEGRGFEFVISDKPTVEKLDRIIEFVRQDRPVDETIDWGECRTDICVNNDPNFGG